MNPCKECIRNPCLYRAACNIQCDRQIKPPRTNFQRITESPEKLAEWISDVIYDMHNRVDYDEDIQIWLDWLNEPWEEDES